MIIKFKRFLSVLFLLPFLVSGQGAIGWLNEEKAMDSVGKWSFEEHSAVYPKIRQAYQSNFGFALGSKSQLIPTVDVGLQYG